MAHEHGLELDEHAIAVIDMLAPHHENHSFGYRDPGYKTFPVVNDVRRALADLFAIVEPEVVGNLLKLNPPS